MTEYAASEDDQPLRLRAMGLPTGYTRNTEIRPGRPQAKVLGTGCRVDESSLLLRLNPQPWPNISRTRVREAEISARRWSSDESR